MTESKIELTTLIVYREDKDMQWQVYKGKKCMTISEKKKLQGDLERRYRRKWREETGMDDIPKKYVPVRVFARYKEVG